MGCYDGGTAADGTPEMETVRMGGNEGWRGAPVACGEQDGAAGISYRHVCFPIYFIKTCHIMGPNTGYINRGIENKQTPQTNAEVIR